VKKKENPIQRGQRVSRRTGRRHWRKHGQVKGLDDGNQKKTNAERGAGKEPTEKTKSPPKSGEEYFVKGQNVADVSPGRGVNDPKSYNTEEKEDRGDK